MTEPADRRPPPTASDSTTLQRSALVMVWLSAFSTPLMLSAVNVALPSIAGDLSLDAVRLSWVPLAYLLAAAMFVLVFARLGDMTGLKRIFLFGSAGVMVSSLLAASAWTGDMLLALRFMQGVFTAALYATQMAIVSSVFPPARRGQAIGLTVSSVYVGLTVGPALGGWLLDLWGWRACLLVQVPFSIAVLAIGCLRVRGDWAGGGHGGFDLAGTALYMLSMLSLAVGGSMLPGVAGWALLVGGTLGVLGFVYYELHVSHPIFDTRLFFTNRVFGFSCLASFLIYAATYANVVLVSLYLQYLLKLSASVTGLIMMAQPLTMAVASPLTGRLSDRFEPRWLASAGMAITIAGLLTLARLTPATPVASVIAALFITGFGFSLFSAPNANAIMGAVDKRQYGSAAGKLATMRLLGQLCSMGIVTFVFAVTLGAVKITPEVHALLNEALRRSFLVAAAMCVPGVFLSLARGRMHRRHGS